MRPEEPVLCIGNMVLSRGTGEQAFTVSLSELHLAAGDVVAITGPSGCGKSTLVEALGLILVPQSIGQYRLLGQDITHLVKGAVRGSDVHLARLRSQFYGFVPQTGGVLPYLTVGQNIRLQANIQRKSTDSSWLDGVITRLGIEGLLDRYPRELSMGQRQRVSFLRAIAHRPAILLADEPTAALDPHHAAQIFGVMLDIARELHIATVVVTHEWDLIDSLVLTRLQARSVGPAHMAFDRV